MYMYILFQIWTLFNYNNYRFITEYVSCKNNTKDICFKIQNKSFISRYLIKINCYNKLHSSICYNILHSNICYYILHSNICYNILHSNICYKVSNHQLISLRFSTKFVFFRAYLVILS